MNDGLLDVMNQNPMELSDGAMLSNDDINTPQFSGEEPKIPFENTIDNKTDIENKPVETMQQDNSPVEITQPDNNPDEVAQSDYNPLDQVETTYDKLSGLLSDVSDNDKVLIEAGFIPPTLDADTREAIAGSRDLDPYLGKMLGGTVDTTEKPFVLNNISPEDMKPFMTDGKFTTTQGNDVDIRSVKAYIYDGEKIKLPGKETGLDMNVNYCPAKIVAFRFRPVDKSIPDFYNIAVVDDLGKFKTELPISSNRLGMEIITNIPFLDRTDSNNAVSYKAVRGANEDKVENLREILEGNSESYVEIVSDAIREEISSKKEMFTEITSSNDAVVSDLVTVQTDREMLVDILGSELSDIVDLLAERSYNYTKAEFLGFDKETVKEGYQDARNDYIEACNKLEINGKEYNFNEINDINKHEQANVIDKALSEKEYSDRFMEALYDEKDGINYQEGTIDGKKMTPDQSLVFGAAYLARTPKPIQIDSFSGSYFNEAKEKISEAISSWNQKDDCPSKFSIDDNGKVWNDYGFQIDNKGRCVDFSLDKVGSDKMEYVKSIIETLPDGRIELQSLDNLENAPIMNDISEVPIDIGSIGSDFIKEGIKDNKNPDTIEKIKTHSESYVEVYDSRLELNNEDKKDKVEPHKNVTVDAKSATIERSSASIERNGKNATPNIARDKINVNGKVELKDSFTKDATAKLEHQKEKILKTIDKMGKYDHLPMRLKSRHTVYQSLNRTLVGQIRDYTKMGGKVGEGCFVSREMNVFDSIDGTLAFMNSNVFETAILSGIKLISDAIDSFKDKTDKDTGDKKDDVDKSNETPNDTDGETHNDIENEKPDDTDGESPNDVENENSNDTDSENPDDIENKGSNDTNGENLNDVENEKPNDTDDETPNDVENEENSDVEAEEPDDIEGEEPNDVEVEDPDDIENEEPNDVEVEDPDDIENEEPNDVEVENPDDIENEEPNDVEVEDSDDIENEEPNDVEVEDSNDIENEEPNDVEVEDSDDIENEEPNDVEVEDPDDIENEEPNDVEVENPDDIENEEPNDVEVEDSDDIDNEESNDVEVENPDDIENEENSDVETEEPDDIEGEEHNDTENQGLESTEIDNSTDEESKDSIDSDSQTSEEDKTPLTTEDLDNSKDTDKEKNDDNADVLYMEETEGDNGVEQTEDSKLKEELSDLQDRVTEKIESYLKSDMSENVKDIVGDAFDSSPFPDSFAEQLSTAISDTLPEIEGMSSQADFYSGVGELIVEFSSLFSNSDGVENAIMDHLSDNLSENADIMDGISSGILDYKEDSNNFDIDIEGDINIMGVSIDDMSYNSGVDSTEDQINNDMNSDPAFNEQVQNDVEIADAKNDAVESLENKADISPKDAENIVDAAFEKGISEGQDVTTPDFAENVEDEVTRLIDDGLSPEDIVTIYESDNPDMPDATAVADLLEDGMSFDNILDMYGIENDNTPEIAATDVDNGIDIAETNVELETPAMEEDYSNNIDSFDNNSDVDYSDDNNPDFEYSDDEDTDSVDAGAGAAE